MRPYPARVRADDSGFVVTFRDIPEAITQGSTKEEAIENAVDALAEAMEFYFEDRREVPEASEAKRGEVLIDLPSSVAAKVLLLNEMIRQEVTPSELARRLETSPQAVNRIVDLGHATKIDTIAQALHAVGRRLVLEVQAA